MQKTIKKLFIAALCALLVMSSLAAVVARYDYDGGGAYFSAAFLSVCSIRDYRKLSLEPLPGCDDARICSADSGAAANRDTDSDLPGAADEGNVGFHGDSEGCEALGARDGTQQKAFHMRI